MLRNLCFSAFALVLVLQAGCALRHYDVTLSNGVVIGAKSKPKLEAGFYVFTDLRGEKQAVPQHRISEIAPHVEKKQKSPFNNYGAK